VHPDRVAGAKFDKVLADMLRLDVVEAAATHDPDSMLDERNRPS
jgi:hypothetical protein